MSRSLLIIVAFGLLTNISLAETLNVPAEYSTIQEAIDAASDGDVVLVASGNYNELIDFDGKAIAVSGSGVDFTTIDGSNLLGSVVTFDQGEEQGSILENVKVIRGSGTFITDPVFGPVPCGGGVMIFSSSPTIRDCVFSDNACWGGAGMMNLRGSPQVKRCVFSMNVSEGHGGGAYNLENSDPEFIECTFEFNDAAWGGGMTSTVDCEPKVTNCIFIGNTVFNVGGGMYNRSRSNPTVIDCLFYANIQSGNPLGSGGGICSYGVGNGGGPCFPTILDCHFEHNVVSGDGGAISHAYDVHATVTGCTFDGNEAGRNGGGMMCAGNDDPYFPSNALVTDCVFEENHAIGYGGGFHSRHSSPTVDGCAFRSNTAGTAGGGASFENSAFAGVMNSLFCGNLPGNYDGIYDDLGGNTYDNECADCPGDITGDGHVGVSDLLAVIADWGTPYNVNDLLTVIQGWGPCP